MGKDVISIFIIIILAILNCIVFEWFTFINGVNGHLVFTLILILTIIIQFYIESIKDETTYFLNKASAVLINMVLISAIVLSISVTIQSDLYNSFAYLYSGIELVAPILLMIFNIRYIRRLNRSIVFRIIKISFIIIAIKIIEVIILYLFIFLNFDGNDIVNLFISFFSILFCYCVFLCKTKYDINDEDNDIIIRNITMSFTILFITFPYSFYSYLLSILMLTK
jgi:hypothetical protein